MPRYRQVPIIFVRKGIEHMKTIVVAAALFVLIAGFLSRGGPRSYGSTAYAGMFVGETPGANVGPSA
jgi:hypothetical protein